MSSLLNSQLFVTNRRYHFSPRTLFSDKNFSIISPILIWRTFYSVAKIHLRANLRFYVIFLWNVNLYLILGNKCNYLPLTFSRVHCRNTLLPLKQSLKFHSQQPLGYVKSLQCASSLHINAHQTLDYVRTYVNTTLGKIPYTILAFSNKRHLCFKALGKCPCLSRLKEQCPKLFFTRFCNSCLLSVQIRFCCLFFEAP